MMIRCLFSRLGMGGYDLVHLDLVGAYMILFGDTQTQAVEF